MIYEFDSLESTQDLLKEKLKNGEKFNHLDAILAHHQTRGRGRMHREWKSGVGNLYCSLFYRPRQLPIQWVPLFVSLAVMDAVQGLHLETSQSCVKWPNDLLMIDGSKWGGVLCEGDASGLVVGVGVNLKNAPELKDANYKSAALSSLANIVPGVFLEQVLKCLETEPTLEELRKRYLDYSYFKKGDEVTFTDLRTKVSGRGWIQSLSEHGGLIITNEQGHAQTLYTEEVKKGGQVTF